MLVVNSRAIQAAVAISTEAPAPRQALSWFSAGERVYCQSASTSQKTTATATARAICHASSASY